MFIPHVSIFLNVIQQNDCSDNLHRSGVTLGATTDLEPKAVFQGQQANIPAGLKGEMQLPVLLFQWLENFVPFFNCPSLLKKNQNKTQQKHYSQDIWTP